MLYKELDGSVKLNYKDVERLIQFFDFLQDKIEDCYKQETKTAIQRFIKDMHSTK